MDLILAGRIVWAAMIAGWFLIRRPFKRQAKSRLLIEDCKTPAERCRLAFSNAGLGVAPFIWVAFGEPRVADYQPRMVQLFAGFVVAIAALILFRAAHKALGALWSDSLQLKQAHQLVTTGVYRHLRHPIYSAFWLMAVAQALLLPNLVAGLAGLVGFGVLFFSRIGPEETMMERAFGRQYLEYRRRTKRIIPFVY